MNIKYLLTFLVFCFLAGTANSQHQCALENPDGEAIPYAHVYLPSFKTGTMSDEEGLFSLPLEGKSDSDSIIFSCLNYENLKLSVGEIKGRAKQGCKVVLSPSDYDLKSVEIEGKSVGFRNKLKGVKKMGKFNRSGYNFSGRGSERGILIGNDKRCRIDEIKFWVNNISGIDSFLVEVNLYQYKNGEVSEKIQKERLFVTVQKRDKDSAVSVMLKDQLLYAEGSFVVSTTMLTDDTKAITMLESSQKDKFTGLRHLTDGRWVRTGDCPSIGVSVSYPLEN